MEKEYAEQLINKMLADRLSYAEMVKVISIIDARLNKVRKGSKGKMTALEAIKQIIQEKKKK